MMTKAQIVHTDAIIEELVDFLCLDYPPELDIYDKATKLWKRLEELGIAKNFDERMKDNEGQI